MVPFHDSDVAENRWKEGEWRQFELWERIEFRFRRKRFWSALGAVILFLAILSIPIIQDRAPKWIAKTAMRKLAVRANQMKVDAAALGIPLQLRLQSSEQGLEYVIEKVDRCDLIADSPGKAQEWSRVAVFSNDRHGRKYVALTPENATQLGLERVTTALCYDPSAEPGATTEASPPVYALGILTAKDLAEGRLERAAFLNFSGLSAEIDFD
jgi:hypothetical protein